ncbi:Rrf2 family transcriptional regulator [Bacillus sp. FSL K6-0994]|uniref:Rrf2 family transcriptional regulator n=1 Tax=Bacillus sp. FSL K6-0994 TaxID=2921457 RepID=UPI00315A7D7C
MKYSKATNYALHTMVFLTLAPKGRAIGVEPLAKIQDLSPTYLSKILTKLVKAGLIESTPGAKGGYTLIKRKEDISFLDVIQAVEGQTNLFRCSLEHDSFMPHDGCLIEQVMQDVETKMQETLSQKRLIDIANQLEQTEKNPFLNV